MVMWQIIYISYCKHWCAVSCQWLIVNYDDGGDDSSNDSVLDYLFLVLIANSDTVNLLWNFGKDVWFIVG